MQQRGPSGAFSAGSNKRIGSARSTPVPFRLGPASGALLRLARSNAGTSRAPFGELGRHPASRRIRRIQPPLSSRPQAGPDRLRWSHARRKFFELADIAASARRGKKATPISPIAFEAVKRIDAIFDIERDVNGKSAEERLRVRRETSAELVAALETWLRTERAKLSRHAEVAKAIDYMLTRWPDLPDEQCGGTRAARFGSWAKIVGVRRIGTRCRAGRDDVRTDSNREAQRHRSAGRARHALTRIADTPQTRLPALLPWNWTHRSAKLAA